MSNADRLLELLEKLPAEKFDKVMNILSGDDKEEVVVENKKTTKEPEDFTMKKVRPGKHREVVKSKGNVWVDTGEERTEDKIVKTITPRVRGKRQFKIKIMCDVCKREVEVSSSLPRTEFYRCERCVGR